MPNKPTKLLIALAMMAVLCLSTTAEAAQKYVSIATGGSSGTYFPIGGAIASAVSRGSKLQVTAETGNASVANINLVSRGEIEIAFVQNDIAFWAFHGQLMFKKPLKNIRAVAALYPEHIQLILAENSTVKNINDLKGKRVGVGAAGSGVAGDVEAIFGIAGMSFDNIKKDKTMDLNFLDFGATTNRFKDNQIDAGFVVAGYPTSSVMELSMTKTISLMSFEDAFMAKLIKTYPYFVDSKIPAGTYNGINHDVRTPAVMAILVTHSDVADSVIYDFTKAMFENIKDIHKSHAKGKEINLNTALDGLTVPLHPGAAKYFKEKGLTQK